MTFKNKGFFGLKGEDAAVNYLKNKKYQILKRNFQTCGCEIDIIALDKDIVCFIEVKTRKTTDYGFPEEFVNIRKIKKIIRAATIFCSRKKYNEMKVRFDIISVIYGSTDYIIDHLSNAFENDFY